MLEKYTRNPRKWCWKVPLAWEVDQVAAGLWAMANGPVPHVMTWSVSDLGWRSRELAGLGRGEPIVWLTNKLCEMDASVRKRRPWILSI